MHADCKLELLVLFERGGGGGRGMGSSDQGNTIERARGFERLECCCRKVDS